MCLCVCVCVKYAGVVLEREKRRNRKGTCEDGLKPKVAARRHSGDDQWGSSGRHRQERCSQWAEGICYVLTTQSKGTPSPYYGQG